MFQIMKHIGLITLFAIVVIGIGLLLWKNKRDSYVYLPLKSPYYYQNLPPSLTVENNYHGCVLTECKGDYDNYECRQKCYIKTMKNGTLDKADLICHNILQEKGEDAYYQCLDSVYGNYLWMDRNTGVGSCKCPDGTTSYRDTYSKECVCRDKHYPLNVRTPTNESGEKVLY